MQKKKGSQQNTPTPLLTNRKKHDQKEMAPPLYQPLSKLTIEFKNKE